MKERVSLLCESVKDKQEGEFQFMSEMLNLIEIANCLF